MSLQETNPLVVAAIDAMQLDREKVRKFGVINTVEEVLVRMDSLNYEVEHYCFPGFIARQVLLRANTMITTELHNTWHPYVVSYGHVTVYDEHTGKVLEIRARNVPNGHFTSLTEPGTRRLLLVHEDTLWTTLHPCNHDDPNRLIVEATLPNTNPLLQ